MTTDKQDDACSQPGEVRSSAPLGLPPLPQCYMRHWINCPFEDIGLFKEEQMRAYAAAAVAAERAAAKNRYHSTLDSMDAEIERLRAALQAIADDVCDNTYTRTARAALKPNV